jgi:hypothetical protein
LNRLFLIVLISLSISSCSYKNINYETGPDLIIESVRIKVNLEDGKDRTGMPARSGYKSLDITLRIKNIGTKSFNSPVYVASTNSEQDFQLNYFDNFKLVEPSPTSISPNELVEVKFIKRVQQNSSNMKFQVNYHSAQEKIAKEKDYFNNTYSVKY